MYHQFTRALFAACVLVVFSLPAHAFEWKTIKSAGCSKYQSSCSFESACASAGSLHSNYANNGHVLRYVKSETGSARSCALERTDPAGSVPAECGENGTWVNEIGGGACGVPPYQCGIDDNKSPEQCSCEESGSSWVTGLEICGVNPDENNPNERDGCEANGGTFGLFNNETVCLPSDFGVPSCSSSGNIATYSDSNGGNGWACEPDPTGNSNETDTDNDGIPDIADTDIDNDGIPNASDDDVDGDGVLNTSDPSYQGESVDNSLTESKLDKIHDSIKNLKTDLTEQVPDSKSDNITNEALSTGQSELDTLFDSALSDDSNLSVTIQESEISIDDEINSIFPDFTCVAYNQPVFQGYGFNITCDSTNRLRDLLSWVFYLFTAWYLFSLITTPVNKD